ncbi:hypothetical protein [Arabiibacter massiliensis]|uniref:hypothetical protein n=1 Tax=Arabiibacter massiliensis TaxID=1870985 RepID=UPI0009B988A4|nr:hypothetical protein [Arabiibacter massiliensis]
MKLKAAFRYQAVELVQSAAVFCLIIGAILAVLFVMMLSGSGQVALPAMGALPYALMALLALSTLPGDIRFLMQMGLTRPQMIASTAASLGAVCLFLGVVEAVCSVVFPAFWPSGQSLFLMTYGVENGPVLDFLFMFLGCAAASGAALAFAALQMRFGTRRVVLSLIAIFVVVPWVLSAVLPSSIAFWLALSDATQAAFGFGAGASLANPFITFAVVAALGVLIAWTAVRRIEVR